MLLEILLSGTCAKTSKYITVKSLNSIHGAFKKYKKNKNKHKQTNKQSILLNVALCFYYHLQNDVLVIRNGKKQQTRRPPSSYRNRLDERVRDVPFWFGQAQQAAGKKQHALWTSALNIMDEYSALARGTVPPAENTGYLYDCALEHRVLAG